VLPLWKLTWPKPAAAAAAATKTKSNQHLTRLGLEVGVTRWAEMVVLCTLLFMAVGSSTNSFYL